MPVTNHLNPFSAPLSLSLIKIPPLKKMSLKECKVNLEPWLTKGILTSINNKNNTYQKYCWARDQNRKNEFHTFLK